MMPKRKRLADTEEGPSPKRSATPELVAWNQLQVVQPDVVSCLYKVECMKPDGFGIKAALERLDSDDSLKGYNQKVYILYPAFKEALRQQMEVFASGSYSALLLHGVPDLGKSALSVCLAHYLAIAYGNSCYLRLRFSGQGDKNLYENEISTAAALGVCLVIDQCNMSCVEPSIILDKDLTNGEALPYVFFTSGHYQPPPDWLARTGPNVKHHRIYYRVIDLVMSEKDVKELLEQINMSFQGQERKILEITSSYGRLYRVILKLTGDEENLGEVLEKIYDLGHITTDSSLVIKHLWVLWPEYFQKDVTNSEITDMTEQDFPLSPQGVVYLRRVLTQEKIPPRDGILTALAWLKLSGLKESYSQGGYIEYQEGDYNYVFGHLNAVKDLMKIAKKEYTSPEALQTYAQTFYYCIREPQLHSIARKCFEQYIRIYICYKKRIGLRYSEIHPECFQGIAPVEQCWVSSVQELCDQVNMHAQECDIAKEHTAAIWCDGQVHGCKSFVGYNFAYMEVHHKRGSQGKHVCTLCKLELLHVTESLVSKKGHPNMGDVLLDVRKEMKAKGFITTEEQAQQLIKPYVIVPNCNTWKGKTINIPCGKANIEEVPVLAVQDIGFEL